MKFIIIIIIIIIVIYARPSLQLFLSKMHQSDGSFIMHYDGEVDVRLEKKRERGHIILFPSTRGAYCALVPAILTNTLTNEMTQGTALWVTRYGRLECCIFICTF